MAAQERQKTTYLQMVKPRYDEDADIQDINNNMDILDAAFHGVEGVVAPEFVKGTANAAETYVMYEGKVYYLPNGHTAGTTWENTTKTQTNIGAQLKDIKNNAGAKIDDTAGSGVTNKVWSADKLTGAIAALLAVIAPQFVQATANAAGSYVTYNNALYYLPEGHTANTTWDNTIVVHKDIGEVLQDLKINAGAQIDDTAESGVTNKVWSANKVIESLSDLLDVVAPKFAKNTANNAGTYVMYNNELYQLPDGHTAGTTWANTTKTKKDIGEVLAYLKENAGAQIDDTAGLGDNDVVWSADKVTETINHYTEIIALDFGTVSSLPAVVSDSRIVSTMRVDHCVAGNPDAFVVEPTLTIEDGTVTLQGELQSGASSSLIVYVAHNPLVAESPVVIDETLNVRGAAADSMAVGTALNQKLAKPSTSGTNGQVLRTNGSGGVYWDDEANQEDIAGAVEDWLDEHPEATTTLEDGAVTFAKLHESLRGKVEAIDQKAPAIIDADTGYRHENVDSFIMNGNALAFGNARYADKKNLIVAANNSFTASGVAVVINGGIATLNGESTGADDRYFATHNVDMPAGSYIFKIEPYLGTSELAGTKNMHLDIWYDGNETTTYDKRVTLAVKDTAQSNTFTATSHVYKIRVWLGVRSNSTYNDYRLFYTLFPSDVTITDTGETISSTGTLTVDPASEMSEVDTMMHSSTVQTLIDTKTYVDNHTQEIDFVYFRPEDYGAKGDGSADDSAALQACINAAQAYDSEKGKAIRGFGTYKIATGIVFNCRELDVFLNKIIYTGSDAAVQISGSFSRFAFQSIRAYSGGNYAVCIRCYQSQNSGYTTTFHSNVVTCSYMRSSGNCVEFCEAQGLTTHTIMYNDFYCQYQRSDNANIFAVMGNMANEINCYGKYVNAENGYLVYYNRDNIRSEGTIRMFYYCLETDLKNGTNGEARFYYCRFTEMTDRQTRDDRTTGRIYVWDSIYPQGEIISPTTGIDITSIDVSNANSWEDCLAMAKDDFESGPNQESYKVFTRYLPISRVPYAKIEPFRCT